jgi:hypothetical protein
LNQQLIKALRQTDALIVVYTSGTNDWSYVMYECGVATDESGDVTNTYVFQCMNEVPVVFTDTFMVNVRKREELKRFCRQLFKSSDFFPKQSQPIALNWDETDIENATEDISKRILLKKGIAVAVAGCGSRLLARG